MGPKVNFHKSFSGALGVDRRVLESYATIMYSRLIKLPFTYLGILVGANPRKMETWNPIVDKITKRLHSGKHKSLSFTGKVCLINSIISSLPLFYVFLQNA